MAPTVCDDSLEPCTYSNRLRRHCSVISYGKKNPMSFVIIILIDLEEFQ